MTSSDIFFSDSTSINSGVDDPQNPKFDYSGNFDQQGFRDRYGCQKWDRPFHHKYAGNFLYNNMHEKGFYFISQEDGISFYDGQFYNNKLEGYGQVIYNDGRVHEGLFKDNRKFGPGVLTYPDGTQDVGLWNGNHLIRLSISVSSDFVFSLCKSPASKIKLLRFKKIVPAISEKKDVAKDLMGELTEESFARRYPELYNPHVRNEHSLFFDRRLYDLAQLGSEDTLIEVLEDETLVDVVSDINDAEDDGCPCVNERCIYVTKQIDELQSELAKLNDMKCKYENQLQKCKVCCKVATTSFCGDVPKSCSAISSNLSSAYLDSGDMKYPSRVSIVEVNDTKQVVEKNLEQMRLQSSIVEDIISSSGGTLVNHELAMMKKMLPKQESINKIFMSTKQFRSDLSINSSVQEKFLDDATEKYTCPCLDEEIPNTDFLVDQLEKLKRKEKFYHTIINFLNEVLRKEFSTVNKSTSSKVFKLQVEDLLSWNNGKTAIEILQHSFRYRNFENILSFNIKSLLIGDRKAFGTVGIIESTSINFLKHCMCNKLEEVKRDLFHHNVYPDLSDARGNTGLHLACSGDCHEIIGLLANIGANLDAFNDECLTPLSLSILRYIAKLKRVVFWDKAFLSEIILNAKELDQVIQWRPHESLISFGEFVGSSPFIPLSNHRSSTDEMKRSSDEMSVKIRSHLQSIKINSISSKLNLNYLFSTTFIEDYERYKKAVASRIVEDAGQEDVEGIEQTIKVLLHYGADPNIGDFPMKPVLLAIFSNSLNLVEKLLKHAANPNSANEENLTALHILASLPFSSSNVQMAEMFLKYSSDPNRKSSNDLWFEQNEELIGNYVSPLADIEDREGKTPLEMVVMRKDYDEDNVYHQCDLVRVFIEYGAVYNQYYLGHTPLSMAVLRGNNKLIETLHRYVQLGQTLGEYMGNALTVFGLYRFPSVQPFVFCRSTIDKLISLGMNPFDRVYSFSNVFEFFLNDYSKHMDYDVPRIRTSLEAEDASFRKAVYSSNYNLTKDCNKLSVAYLKEIGRDILMTLYQCRAMQILLLFAAEDLLYHKCLENMAKFFTIREALNFLKFHINQNKVIMDSNYERIIINVLNFIKENSVKVKNSRKTLNNNQPITPEPPLILEEEVSKLRTNIEVPNYIVMYALDKNPEKYEVCFHCMRKSDKQLLCCPCCGSVNFCSEMCNKYNNKLGTKHSCNLLFYDEMRNAFEKSNEKFPPTGIDLLMLEAKQTREEERKVELLRRQAEEEEQLKKQLRKSQKKDSQLTLQEAKSLSRSLIEKSTSVFLIEEKKKLSKKKKLLCCKKPSSIFVCDETEQLQPRKLNCGFHCGQVIPDVQIDDEGNIVREKEFCECYPLCKKETESSRVDETVKSVVATTGQQEIDDQSSLHYSISQIFGGALSSEGRKIREVQELDMLIDSFAKEEKRESIVDENIKPYIENFDYEEEDSIQELHEIDKAKRKDKNLTSESNITKKRQETVRKEKYTTGKPETYDESKNKKRSEERETVGKEKYTTGKPETYDESKKKKRTEGRETVEEEKYTTGKPETYDESKKKKRTEGRETAKKAAKKETKVRSATEIVKKKKEKKEKDGTLTAKEKKLEDAKSKSKPERELSLDEKKKRKKKTTKMKTRSESTLDSEKIKKQKKGKEDKIMGDSKKDKKTMTKKHKEKKGKQEGIQADIKSKGKKSEGTRSKSTISSKKQKTQKEKIGKTVEKRTKKPEKKKPSGKKKARELERKGVIEKSKKESKRKPISKKTKHRSETISAKKEEKVQKFKSKTDEKAVSVERHDGKIKRDVTIGTTSATLKALDSSLMHPEKILALSSTNFEDFKKISKVYQYFLELIAKYFPDFDLSCLMLPFACFMDGQLYYKFADALPYYCRTYSTI